MQAAGYRWLPAEPTALASFIDSGRAGHSIATIKRRIYAIKFAHRIADLPVPTARSEVRLACRRVARAKLRRPKQVLGLTAELLERIIKACPDTLAGSRDAALISVGYDTLCRSSELAAMRVEDLTEDLSSINIPRSKSDPFGDGRLGYLSARSQRLIRTWLKKSGLGEGPVFRGLNTGKLKSRHLNTSSIRHIVKRAASRASLGEAAGSQLSGHSMRVGAAQDMMEVGMDALAIMQAGGWRTYSVLARYVENARGQRVHSLRHELLSSLQIDQG